MTKNNSKEPTWKDIEEEFRKEFVIKSNAGTGLLRYTDADKIINFFKHYFQEIECDCCGWDDAGLTHEYYCKLKQ